MAFDKSGSALNRWNPGVYRVEMEWGERVKMRDQEILHLHSDGWYWPNGKMYVPRGPERFRRAERIDDLPADRNHRVPGE